jgi:hypothetical protein
MCQIFNVIRNFLKKLGTKHALKRTGSQWDGTTSGTYVRMVGA